MIRRPRRTVPATIVALVLLAVAVLVTISCVQLLLGRAPLLPFTSMASFGSSLTWTDTVTLVVAAVLAVLGVVLLVVALSPGTPTVLPLTTDAERTTAGVSRRTLRRDLTTTARSEDGVRTASVDVGRRTVSAKVRTSVADTSDVSERVRGALEERIADISPARRPRVKVGVTSDRSG